MSRIPLTQIVERLQAEYGKQKPPRLAGPWEMVLWENVAYLAGDERQLRIQSRKLALTHGRR